MLEESRKRRQAILDKHRGSQSVQASEGTPAPSTAVSTPQSEVKEAQPQSQQPFSLVKTATYTTDVAPDGSANAQDASAAEFDPDADRAQELERLEQRRQVAPPPANHPAEPPLSKSNEEFQEIEVTDDEDEDDMDMFALSDDDDASKSDAKPKKTKIIRVPLRGASVATSAVKATAAPISDPAAASMANLSSNWDDNDGYLRTILGETLDERYQISAVLGKGMFASVVRARDLRSDGRHVAIKIVRVQESMYRAGLKEVAMLRKLNAADPDDRKHVVRLERHFDYKGHLCMVFESLGMNLRDVVRRYGRDVGLNLQAVRVYAHQLLLALSHLAKNEVMHADIKPDNVLVNDAKTTLKVCDLGSASYVSEMEITPYLVSRFYRAPEIILGQPYDCAIDVWSTACTIYELATGKILFPGRTNNHMLLLMQEARGRFTAKQLRKSQFGEQHFDDTNAFLGVETDKSTGKETVRRVMIGKPSADVRSRLLPPDAAKGLKPEEVKATNALIDLLERCLELDPAKRISAKDALGHAFFANI